MEKQISEVVKEYVLDVDGLDFTVRGRITKSQLDDKTEFSWAISHHYRPTKEAGSVYYPSKITFDDMEGAEFALQGYMAGFTDLDVTPNKFY